MTATKPRQKKTPRQRAEEALGIAERRVTKLTADAKKARKHLDSIETDLREAQARLDYVKKDPALQPNPTTATTPGGTTA